MKGSMAIYLWWTGVAVHFLFATWALFADLILIWGDDGSVTDYLRRRPSAFWFPAIIGVAGLIILWFHLYVVIPTDPPIKKG